MASWVISDGVAATDTNVASLRASCDGDGDDDCDDVTANRGVAIVVAATSAGELCGGSEPFVYFLTTSTKPARAMRLAGRLRRSDIFMIFVYLRPNSRRLAGVLCSGSVDLDRLKHEASGRFNLE